MTWTDNTAFLPFDGRSSAFEVPHLARVGMLIHTPRGKVPRPPLRSLWRPIDDNNVVELFNVVEPDTFNDDIIVAELFNVVEPDTFNDDTNVVLFDNVVEPDTFNDDVHVVVLFNVVEPDTFNDDVHVV